MTNPDLARIINSNEV